MQQKRLKSIQKTPQTKDAKKLSPTKRNPTHNSKNLWVIDKSPWEESKNNIQKFMAETNSQAWEQTKWNKNFHFSGLVKDNRILYISTMVYIVPPVCTSRA